MDERPRTLAGRYELAEVIGRGGMGTVYRAVDVVLGRSVAVKTLTALVADQDPTSVARFEREARAVAALSHPAVVAVYDTGADAATHFIVMELVAGRSLQAILRDEGPLEPERAADIARRVADALAAAHAAGIVHRDIKPANVMVAEDGSVKVLDFGIARAMGTTTLTHSSAVLGTAAYMSPEQAVGEPADERSDVYSLGCVLYALLAGHPPFTGEGSAAILNQHASIAPRPPRAENRHVSPGLSALVMEMLAKSPGDRPQSAADVRDRLSPLSGSPRAAPVATKPTVSPDETARTRRLAPAVGAVPGPADPARRRLIVVAALFAAAVAIALVALASGQGSPHRLTGAIHGGTASTATVPRERSTTSTASATTPTSTAPVTGRPTTAPSTTGRPLTVSEATGALTALIAQDVGSGTIDAKAGKQITNALTEIVNSWDTGNATDARHKLADLSQQVTELEQQGQIAAAATPALKVALENLSAALANAAPAQTQTQTAGGNPSPQPSQPPGHGGLPPGQAKKLSGKHGGGP